MKAANVMKTFQLSKIVFETFEIKICFLAKNVCYRGKYKERQIVIISKCNML